MKNTQQAKNDNDSIIFVKKVNQAKANKADSAKSDSLKVNSSINPQSTENKPNLFNSNLNENQKKICEILNYKEPTEIQELVIESLYNQNLKNNLDLSEKKEGNLNDNKNENRENLILKYKAGSGKTFAFMLAMLRNFDFNCDKLQAIIILPTRELALQTSEYFDKINNFKNEEDKNFFNFKYQILIGGQPDINEKKSNKFFEQNKIKIKNDTQILIGTIGKLAGTFKGNNKNVNSLLPLFSEFKTLILDEADKLLFQNKNNTLKNFLLKISEINRTKIKNNPSGKQVSFILVSASLDEQTKNFYKSILHTDFKALEPKAKAKAEFSMGLGQNDKLKFSENEKNNLNQNSLSNIKEYFYVFKQEERTTYFENKYMKLMLILNSLKDNFKQALIFYNQKGKGEELAADLRDQGWYSTTFIHADLTQDQRVLIYKKIKSLEIKLIICTDLFSRGIDLRTVDLVINFDCPFNKTEYHHRVGRTGRYNTLGNSITFFQENQTAILEDIRKEDVNKLIEVKSIDENFIAMLKKDYEEIKNNNFFDVEVNQKIAKINQAIPISEAAKEELKNENLLKKKRRRTQYEKESLISDWVNADEKIFDEENFLYLNGAIEDAAEEYESIKLEEQNEHESKGNKAIKRLSDMNLNEEAVILSCEQNKDKNRICLYCNFFKMFDN